MFAMKRHCKCKPCRHRNENEQNYEEDSHSRMQSAASWAQDAASVVADRMPRPPMPAIDIPKTVIRHKRRQKKGPRAVAENILPSRKKKHTGAKIVTGILVALLGIGAAAVAAWWQQGA